MRTITHIACLVIDLGCGFVPCQWRGQLIALQSAPAIDPTYAGALSDDAVYRTRAPMAVKWR